MDGNSAHKCAVPVTILFCALSLSPYASSAVAAGNHDP